MTSVVDTNVILVANDQHGDVSPDCVAACAIRLQTIMKTQRIALDADREILREYGKKTTPNSGNRPGDAFLKWALQNMANPRRCDLVTLTPNTERGYDSFPEDDRLAKFDSADRKFVAVSAAHADHPRILQAADSKWIGWESALKDHDISAGVKVFL